MKRVTSNSGLTQPGESENETIFMREDSLSTLSWVNNQLPSDHLLV